MSNLSKLKEEVDDYTFLIKSYETLITTAKENDRDDYNFLIKSYKDLLKNSEKKIDEIQKVQAPVPEPVPAPEPPKPTETEEERKLREIKELLEANEATIKQCGFQLE